MLYNLPTLDIGLDGATVSIENNQVSYDQNQDSRPIRNYMATLNNQSINFKGNMWRALELPAPLSFGALGDFPAACALELGHDRLLLGRWAGQPVDQILREGCRDTPMCPKDQRLPCALCTTIGHSVRWPQKVSSRSEHN